MKHGRVWIKFAGEKISVRQAAIRIGVTPMCMWKRLEKGVSREELLRPSGRRIRSIFMAAINGELSGDEYIKIENDLMGRDPQ